MLELIIVILVAVGLLFLSHRTLLAFGQVFKVMALAVEWAIAIPIFIAGWLYRSYKGHS